MAIEKAFYDGVCMLLSCGIQNLKIQDRIPTDHVLTLLRHIRKEASHVKKFVMPNPLSWFDIDRERFVMKKIFECAFEELVLFVKPEIGTWDFAKLPGSSSVKDLKLTSYPEARISNLHAFLGRCHSLKSFISHSCWVPWNEITLIAQACANLPDIRTVSIGEFSYFWDEQSYRAMLQTTMASSTLSHFYMQPPKNMPSADSERLLTVVDSMRNSPRVKTMLFLCGLATLPRHKGGPHALTRWDPSLIMRLNEYMKKEEFEDIWSLE
jgi:hypothetical protein